MACQVEQIADCGDISTLARALFVPDKEDANWLNQCHVSISPCGNLLAVGYRSRLCLLTSQWISSSESNTFLISWSGTTPAEVTTLLALSICPSHNSSQKGPDWFCIVVGFKNGSLGFYTNTGHQLFLEKFDDKPVLKISCHTGTYGTLPDDICILYPNCECVVTGQSLFQTLRYAKAQLARVQAGVLDRYSVDSSSIQVRKWTFSDQDCVNDAAVVGLELKNTYDHLLAASTYGGYDTWYRSIPPSNTLVLSAGARPYVGFQYALEGGTAPPLQDVARAVASRIKSALPGWLGGGQESTVTSSEPRVKSEPLSLRGGVVDSSRVGAAVALSPDRRLAAVSDGFGRVAVLDLARGRVIRLLKGCRDAQCAFVQVFEPDSKRPQLSTIKETRRAVFLIIYNPKKGLIDIRLMHRGNRVAVFTATKNGKLLYQTCGLVGAEPNYTHKKLNLPEFQCVLIDPDGKLKKFNVPFFFALEGEHSDRSKDLHILRDLRDYLKRTHSRDYDKDEILKKAADLNTLDLKKHCVEMLIRNYNVSPCIVMACLSLFWKDDVDVQSEKTYAYFKNLVLITLLYRRLNNESLEDMQELLDRAVNGEDSEGSCEKNEQELEFKLLVDDDCILERLLMLAQEKDYRQHQHARVTFADNIGNSYKDFVTSFDLSTSNNSLSIKPDVTPEKLNALASYTFKALIKIGDMKKLGGFIKESSLETKDVVRLLIVHVINMSLEDINLDLIQQLVEVLYYVCRSSKEAISIAYNEVSPWWQSIRDLIVDMPCPLRSMIVAMACKAVSKMYEEEYLFDEEAWESVTKENAKWGILIGKLEDISILTIILLLKETYNGKSLPKLGAVDFDINLKLIYTRGKGSVTELISKWLCSMGVPPRAVVANELMDKNTDEVTEATEDTDVDALFLEDHRSLVDENPRIFKWLSLLRQQFPFSTSSDYILANMSWEYAIAWQKSLQDLDKLRALLDCIKLVSNEHLRLGLATLVWTTYVKQTFEMSCRIVNKVGKLPKERLCLQDVGLTDVKMVKFLETSTDYLNLFYKLSVSPHTSEKQIIKYEKIWDDTSQSLIEVAQDTRKVNIDILNLTFQMSCTIYYQCHFNLKVTKPLNSLYDVDYHYVFESLTENRESRDINMRPSEKLRAPRMKFLTKCVRAAAETVTSSEEGRRDAAECAQWVAGVAELAELWGVDPEFVTQQKAICFFQLGFDSLAEEALQSSRCAAALLQPLLAIAAQRFKRHLERSADPAEWMAAAPPDLARHVGNLESDMSVAAASLASTASVLTLLLRVPRSRQDASAPRHLAMAELMLQAAETLAPL